MIEELEVRVNRKRMDGMKLRGKEQSEERYSHYNCFIHIICICCKPLITYCIRVPVQYV